MAGSMLSIGECMVELMQAEGGMLRKGYAGDTFNTTYYARLFAPAGWAVEYLTAVGTDVVSDEMLSFIEGTGVGTAHIARIEGRMPGLYMIHLKDGERSFSYWRSTSAAKLLADDPERLRAAIEKGDIVFFSGITLAILAPDAVETLLAELRRAKASGKRVVFDPNIRPRLWDDAVRMRATLEAGARAATMLLPSYDDEATHFGDASVGETIERYRGLGVKDIAVKDGANGVTLQFGEAERRHVPAASVSHVVDTTSAGDSFNGSFLARLAAGDNPADAAAFAARVAAAVIGHHGALVEREKLPEAD
ncbi:2-dehydro-3-deoxygluconokinase [Sinorhizobium fredii USDA 205]|uniref:Sugar kinase n=1 Tax=Rhizobium fredii TaxID=380 RepID=A0A844ACB0_RHIFR|nr:sugar kinase [Sinorhizobium fredii]AWM25913.1 2-dehydro-3-deoxygluconate kinase [Sinorhizobium fredii CCBAU 25509]KSV91656.1 2-dehydro-3-deoxygluconokinase [Sinorhizobium fredii USDA 205]MQW99316.1 sugar kinase [Sinorhizobium fredii]MQX09286.1 sugar kinase [Sinorhizobium fredii]UTY50032.1 sugar kinase [Sinorhizobium fredii]